ncbi:short-chain alcohol dehydrogenase [Leucoagaricus gongylophorus]
MIEKLWEYFDQAFPPKPKFRIEDIPDLRGKVIVVTGGNSGIGYETVKVLLLKNAKVYMASRSKERAEEAIATLKEETGNEAIFLQLDLSSWDSVRKASDELKLKETAIHVLFNNGGVMAPPIDQLTRDGYDLQFGTNVMGPYVFTKRLLPLLIAGVKSADDKRARVVNTSSSAQLFTDTIHFEGLGDVPFRKQLGTSQMYMESKLGVILFSNELAKRYGDSGIVSTSLNPGNSKTGLQRYLPRGSMLLLVSLTVSVHDSRPD